MANRRCAVLLLSFLLFLTVTVSLFSFSGSSKSLLLKQAERFFSSRKYQRAYDKYLQVYTSEDANTIEKDFAHYKMGECLEMSGETKLAIREYIKLLNEDTGTYKPAAKRKLIQLYVQVDEKPMAIKLLLGEIDINPRLIRNYDELASLYADTEQYKKALEIYEKMLEKFPTVKSRVENNLISIYQQLGLIDEKIAELKELLTASPDNDKLRKTLTTYYHFQKDYKKAIEEFTKVKSKNTSYYLTLGRLYNQNQQSEQAIAAWLEIIRNNPRNTMYYDRVVEVLKEAGFLHEIIKLYLQARREQRNPNLYFRELANTYEVLGDFDSAMREYFGYINRSPKKRYREDPIRLVNEAINSAIADGESIEKIIAAINKTISENPGHLEPHLVLGEIYLKNKMPAQAVEQFKEAISKSKIKEPRIYSLGKKLADKDYNKEAILLFEELPELTGSNIIYPQWLDVAEVYMRVGQSEEAKQILDRIINRQHRTDLMVKALLMRGQLYYVNARFTKAIKDFRDLINTYPNSKQQESAQLYIAKSYYRAAQYEKASAVINPLLTGMTIGENYYELLYLSARVKLFLDKKEQARKTLQTLAEKYPQGKTANDALFLVNFLQHTPNKHLDQVISALKKEEMQDYRSAISLYSKLLEEEPELKNAVQIWFKIGNLYRKQELPEQAIKAYENILNGFSDSFYIPKTLMQIAEVYQHTIKDEKQAIKTYEKILAEYQDSVLINEARENIENLKLNVSP